MDLRDVEDKANDVAQVLRMIANPHRLLILCQLAEGACCVGDLEQRVALSQSALSQHLARLRQEGIVTARRQGQQVIYDLPGGQVRETLLALYDIYCRREASAAEGSSD